MLQPIKKKNKVMNQTDKVQFNEQLRNRTMNLAVEIRNLLMSIKINSIDRPIVNQLIRSSSSIAANYRAATRGRSDAEFYSKIAIVVEETDETLFWIVYLLKLRVLEETKIIDLRNEVEQLVRLFSAIKKKMREKIGK
jgi:four helix bundle protein